MRLMAALLAGMASDAAAQADARGWAGELWPRGGAAESDQGGQTGAGALDGALSYSFENGITTKAEGQGNTMLGSEATGGRFQAWWQDPALALIGVTAETSRRDGLWQRRYLGQGELYLGPFTLRGQAGYVPGDREGFQEVKGGFFGLVSGGWYPLDALGLNLGGATQAGKGAGFGNVEWAPSFMPPGSSFTLDGAGGADGFLLGLVGVRFTFGPGASGIVRNRQVGAAPGFPSYLPALFGSTAITPPPFNVPPQYP